MLACCERGGRGDGQPITSLIDLEAGTHSLHYHAGAAAQMLVLAASGGYGLLIGDRATRSELDAHIAANQGFKAYKARDYDTAIAKYDQALRGKPGPVYARLYEAYQRAKVTMSI